MQRCLASPSINVLFNPSEILRAPNTQTVYSQESAVFTCETDGGLSGWRVNGTLLQNLQPEIHDDLKLSMVNTANGSTVENLTIPAKNIYNGTAVQCLVLAFGSPSINSEHAILKIQGMLAML